MLSCSLSSLLFCFHSLFLLLLLLPQLHHHLPSLPSCCCIFVTTFSSPCSCCCSLIDKILLLHFCHCSPAAMLPLLHSFPLSPLPSYSHLLFNSYSHSTLSNFSISFYPLPCLLLNPMYYISYPISLHLSLTTPSISSLPNYSMLYYAQSTAVLNPVSPESFHHSISPLLLLFTISSYLLSHSLTLIPCLQLKYFIPHHLFNPSFYLSFNLSISISTAFLNPLPYLIYLPFASYKIFNHLTSLPSSSAFNSSVHHHLLPFSIHLYPFTLFIACPCFYVCSSCTTTFIYFLCHYPFPLPGLLLGLSLILYLVCPYTGLPLYWLAPYTIPGLFLILYLPCLNPTPLLFNLLEI